MDHIKDVLPGVLDSIREDAGKSKLELVCKFANSNQITAEESCKVLGYDLYIADYATDTCAINNEPCYHWVPIGRS